MRRGIATVGVLILLGSAVGAYLLSRKAPLPRIVDAQSGLDFMATDEFMRLDPQGRLDYANRVMDRLNGMDYDEYLRTITRLDDRRMRTFTNLRNTPGYDKIGARLMEIFLDRFWTQNSAKRTATLMVLALAQQGEFGKRPEKYGLPTPDQIKSEMNKFVSNQSVKTQAQCAQFLVELKRHRELMGLKDPF